MAAVAPFPNKWAVLAGPTAYQFVKPLSFCANDVTALGKTLRTTLQFPDTNILEFGAGLAHEPLRNVIYHELGAFLKSGNIKEDDLLMFYFSGHGMRYKKDYLLPVDATPNNLRNTAIEVEDLVDQLTSTKCRNVVMFIDACREAVSGAKGVAAMGEDSRDIAERNGVLSFFSCDPEDLSFEIEELQHGAFTYCLLDAIQSGTCVTAAQVYEHLRREVPVINKKYNKPPQKPFAIIVPDEKRELQVFYSSAQVAGSAARYEVLITTLGDLYTGGDWKIAAAYFNSGVELLNIAKESGLSGDDAERMNLIELLCDGTLNQTAFRVAWDAIERRGRQGARATVSKPSLKPLI